MPDLADWPDPFVLARAVLLDLCPNIAQETPPDPDGTRDWLPFIRLTVIGGGDDTVTDTANIQADCFAASKGDASQLAGLVRQRILATPITAPDLGTIDFGATLSRPQRIPQAAEPPVMYAATYLIHQRRI